MSVQCTNSPLFGVWMPQSHLKHLYYGAECVEKHLLSTIPTLSSKVFILSGKTIFSHTPLIGKLEKILGDAHAATYANIKQHGQAEGVDEATSLVFADPAIDTIISVGGGSPIDSAKVICYRFHKRTGKKLTHIAIPTTLSAAERTAGGGYTQADGTKVGFMHPSMGVSAIFYDPSFSKFTPERLWLSSGMRAVDHAVEAMYHQNASEMPWKALASWALKILAEELPASKKIHGTEEAYDVTTKLHLAAFASSGLRGSNFSGGMGLSHTLGHALGGPYGIPHGETSCLTLAPVIRYKADADPVAASQIARLLPFLGGQGGSIDNRAAAFEVARRIQELVEQLGLAQPSLSDRGVDRDQVPVIAAKATGGSPSESILKLVESLF